MPRATNAPARKRRKQRLFDQAKGYRGGRSKLYRSARETVMRAWAYSYRDRKQRKRDFRRLWITRIRAAANAEGMSYSAFIDGLNKTNIRLDRRILADLAVRHPQVFSRLIAEVKESVSA
ncbi:MAG TPA: 50S ribosomal protein L20 [bacterium]|nr:50S ribosomal protein L20 [bacterium]HPJ71320.1 50S ribosomal protein L20 [bacterium]HPQ66187.1 50S ribosomal protein L20 [bacterium]